MFTDSLSLETKGFRHYLLMLLLLVPFVQFLTSFPSVGLPAICANVKQHSIDTTFLKSMLSLATRPDLDWWHPQWLAAMVWGSPLTTTQGTFPPYHRVLVPPVLCPPLVFLAIFCAAYLLVTSKDGREAWQLKP